jgi:hypothetical protein
MAYAVPPGLPTLGPFGTHLAVGTPGATWISPASYQYFYGDFEFYENNIWSNNANTTGGLTRNTPGVDNHPGIWTPFTGTDSAGASNIHLMEQSLLLSSGQILLEWVIQIPVLSAGSDTFYIRCGAMDNFNPAESSNAVEFRYTDSVNSGKWVLVARNGGTETAVNSTSTVGTGWTRLSIIVVPATPIATFYVEGVSVGTVSTNLPTANPVGLQTQIQKTGGTTSVGVNLDYGYIFNQLASTR